MPFTDPFVANPYPYAFSCTLPSTTNPDAPYEISGAFVSGVYTISWSGGGTLNVDFYNGTTLISTATGTSSITFNLAQSATKAVLWNTVAGVSVVISLTALAIAPVSGVLTTYTASGTPGLVGDAYCVLVGGGGGGGGGFTSGGGGGGGGSGGIVISRVALTGVEALVIGNGGTSGTTGTPGTPGGNGGASTFAGLTAGGGGGGGTNPGTGGTAGTPNGASGGNGAMGTTVFNGQPCVNPNTIFGFMVMGTTGSGGGGFNNVSGIATGGGSGIGTGGTGTGAPGTGYGSGGGGFGWSTYGSTGVGMPGVLYVILVP